MKTQIEHRYKDSGFVYVGNTRLLFARRSILRDLRHDGVDSIYLASAANWPAPTKSEAEAAFRALQAEFGMGEVG